MTIAVTGLSRDLTAAEAMQPGAAAVGRVLAQLDAYVSAVLKHQNLRPMRTTLLDIFPDRVSVKLTLPLQNAVIVFAPEGDLLTHATFLRAVAVLREPVAARLVAHDPSGGIIPLAWALEGYLAGHTLDRVQDPALLRLAARRVGQMLRRIHQLPVAGYGAPSARGRWAERWASALEQRLRLAGGRARLAAVIGTDLAERFNCATIMHADLVIAAPHVLHGAITPERVLVSGEQAPRVEALLRPSAPIGGDPLYDLACGLSPRQPVAFREGIAEGYASAGALDTTQERRLRRLRLFVGVVEALDVRVDVPDERLAAAVEVAIGALSIEH